MFGYTAEEVVGKPVTVLMPPERHHEEPGILARLRRGERIDHYETVRRRKDGSLFDISLTVSPIRDNAGNIVAASTARDITDQKRAEAALRENERRLQDLLATIPAAIYTTDASGTITYYNEAAVEFAGKRPMIGSDKWSVAWKLYWPDGTPLPHDQSPMALAIKENRPIRGKEAIAERPDGTRVPYMPFPTPLHDANGKLQWPRPTPPTPECHLAKSDEHDWIHRVDVRSAGHRADHGQIAENARGRRCLSS